MTSLDPNDLRGITSFDDVIEYHLPTPEQAFELIRARLGSFAPRPFPKKAITSRADGLSYAEIRRAVDEAIKEAVMHDEAGVGSDALGRALEERRRLSEKHKQNNKLVSDGGSRT